MSKEEFLEKSAQLFLEYGSKTLTMDEIAREFGMSKKTLYQKYRNKEALLEEVLDYKLRHIMCKMHYLDSTIENAVERMFCKDEEMESMLNSNKSTMVKQLIKYYPAIFTSHISKLSGQFSEILIKIIIKGRQQGYYRNDFDAEYYSKFFFQLLMSYDSSPYLGTENMDRKTFHDEVVMFYMNAITTEKGKELLKKINNRS